MSCQTPGCDPDALGDQRLACLAREGDQEAFAAIVARYHGTLLGMARRLCADGRAEDAVQQTFLNALVAFRSGTEVRHLSGWLHQILRHTAGRVSGPVEMTLEADREISAIMVEDDVERRLATRQVLTAMAALPHRQREAMVATALEGQSRSAIAGRMGLSEGAVRQLMHRARQTLRAAAYSFIPWPVQRWLMRATSGPTGDQGPEVASVVSSPLPRAAVKLAAVVASGAMAAGYLGPHSARHFNHHQPGAHHADRFAGPGTAVVADGRRAWLAAAVLGGPALRVLANPELTRNTARAGSSARHRGENRSSGRPGPISGVGGRDKSGSTSTTAGDGSDDGAPSPAQGGNGGTDRHGGTSGSPGASRPMSDGDSGSGGGDGGSGSGGGDGGAPTSTTADTSGGDPTSSLASSSGHSAPSGGDGGSGTGSSPSSGGSSNTSTSGSSATGSSTSSTGSSGTSSSSSSGPLGSGSGSGRDLLAGSVSSEP
jgi:RNA polymerase sigma factor (sigma-70 family)